MVDQLKRDQIENLASTVRNALNVSTPVNLEQVVQQLGGRIEYISRYQANYEAVIFKATDGFTIQITEEARSRRQGFSIAHELGHLFLHMGYIVDPQRWNSILTYHDSVYARHGYSEEEYEANEFAASFLMPRDEFIIISNRNVQNGMYQLRNISDYFNVSEEAVLTRGRWLGIFSWN